MLTYTPTSKGSEISFYSLPSILHNQKVETVTPIEADNQTITFQTTITPYNQSEQQIHTHIDHLRCSNYMMQL